MGSQTTSPRESSSAAAVRRRQGGDRGATEELARNATRLALRTAAALVESREEAADVAQEVAIDVLDSLDKLRDPEAFDAWVHRITVRHALRRLKKRRRAGAAETPLALLADADSPPAPEGLDHDTVLATRAALATALAELPPKQRLALALRYVHDLSDAEIAAALGCRTGTVHALLSRGRGALRQDKQLAELALAIRGG
jgi:RNA polymerase sigma-70 factor (ECF subfamily)